MRSGGVGGGGGLLNVHNYMYTYAKRKVTCTHLFQKPSLVTLQM